MHHTEAEQRLFRNLPGWKWPCWKCRPCDRGAECRHAARTADCPFAHGVAQAWCLACKATGHFTDDCPYKLG